MFMTRNLIQHAVGAGLTCLLASGPVPMAAAVPQPPAAQAPAPQVPPAVPPGAPAPVAPAQTAAPAPAPAVAPVAAPVPGTVACPAPVPPATLPSRSFTAQAGMIFHQVIPARLGDFDQFLAYVRDALAKSTNPTVRQQASGWSFWRTVEAGPNGDALYVFIFNPAVPCVDYALGPILAEAYPDPAQLLEIWKLYRNSVRDTGSTLLTLVPAPVVPLTPPLTPPTTTPAESPAKPSPVSPQPGRPVPAPGGAPPPASPTPSPPVTPPSNGR
jgi:hypothetical protein